MDRGPAHIGIDLTREAAEPGFDRVFMLSRMVPNPAPLTTRSTARIFSSAAARSASAMTIVVVR